MHLEMQTDFPPCASDLRHCAVVDKYPFKITQQVDLLVVWHADMLHIVVFKFIFFVI